MNKITTVTAPAILLALLVTQKANAESFFSEEFNSEELTEKVYKNTSLINTNNDEIFILKQQISDLQDNNIALSKGIKDMLRLTSSEFVKVNSRVKKLQGKIDALQSELNQIGPIDKSQLIKLTNEMQKIVSDRNKKFIKLEL